MDGPEEKSGVMTDGKVLSISLPGDPKTKLRPRFSRHKGKVRTYSAQSEEEETVKWQLKSRMVGLEPLEGPLNVEVICIFGRPKSREKLNETFHTVKPDLDNLVKWIGDVGNGILWYDDKQIVTISAVKIYGEKARTIITVLKA